MRAPDLSTSGLCQNRKPRSDQDPGARLGHRESIVSAIVEARQARHFSTMAAQRPRSSGLWGHHPDATFAEPHGNDAVVDETCCSQVLGRVVHPIDLFSVRIWMREIPYLQAELTAFKARVLQQDLQALGIHAQHVAPRIQRAVHRLAPLEIENREVKLGERENLAGASPLREEDDSMLPLGQRDTVVIAERPQVDTVVVASGYEPFPPIDKNHLSHGGCVNVELARGATFVHIP